MRYQTEIQSAIRTADELELVEPTRDAELDEKLRQAQEEWADEQVLDAIFGEPADKQAVHSIPDLSLLLPELNRGSSVPKYRLGSPLLPSRSTLRGA